MLDRGIIFSGLLTLTLWTGLGLSNDPTVAIRKISLETLEDKIRGGWAGQMIGVSFGAPTEFRSNGKMIGGNLPWIPERVSNALVQDDLYVDMTFAETLGQLGLDATTEQFGEAFKNSKYSLWHANAGARRLLNRGIKAPMSGHPLYNIHANDIDFQIESDFIGLMTPGLPQESNKYCDRVGRVMNYGDGLYGGMFVCGMYSAAFFEKDIEKVVEQGLACIPVESSYGKIIRNVINWHRKFPEDWRKTWTYIENQWDKNDSCPDGALKPFNIDAKLNGAYIALGLLYGKADFAKTIEITTRAGQDSDCNPANAMGILGVVLGYSAIPEKWKAGIPAIADQKFDFTQSSFNEITRSTLARAIKVVETAGGTVQGKELIVPIQAPKPPKLEQWDMGIPVKRVDPLDPNWTWTGNWSEDHYWDTDGLVTQKTSRTPGAETTLIFEGTAIALVGNGTQEGGRADLYLDGERTGLVDAYIIEQTNDNDLWHAYGLKPGKHTLRLVLREDADPRSTGRQINIATAVTYTSR